MARYASSITFESNFTYLGRPTCYVCYRPQSHCVCNFVKPFSAHVNTLILQHPHERKKYYSTVKLLSRSLKNAQILRGIDFDPHSLEETLAGQNSYLLYPSPNAIDAAEIALDTTCTVIVIDGTWTEANKIISRNELLKTLPCLSFKTAIRSQYKIRKQPKLGCLSTLESLGHLLKLNAPISGMEKLIPAYDSLFSGFARMVNQQLEYWPERAGERY